MAPTVAGYELALNGGFMIVDAAKQVVLDKFISIETTGLAHLGA